MIAGTPAYMAPVETDLYALGLMPHEVATGQAVFEAETPAAYADLEGAHRAVSWLTLGADIAGVTAFVLKRFAS